MLTTTSIQDGYATEEGSIGVKIYFWDTDGTTAVTPDAGLVWTLVNAAGEVINSRLNVAITAGESIIVELAGDDLVLPEKITSARYVVSTGTYTSSTLGAGTTFVHQHQFHINPVKKLDIWP